MTRTECFWVFFIAGLIVGTGLGAMIMFGIMAWRAISGG